MPDIQDHDAEMQFRSDKFDPNIMSDIESKESEKNQGK